MSEGELSNRAIRMEEIDDLVVKMLDVEEMNADFPDIWRGMTDDELRKNMTKIAEWKWLRIKKQAVYNIVAFTKDWKFKGYVDPSIRDNVLWIRIEDAMQFRKDNKPKDEFWLIKVVE